MITDLFTGAIGVTIIIVGLLLFFAALFLPLFVWGIYNASKRQEAILRDQLKLQQDAARDHQAALEAILEANNAQIRILWAERGAA